MLKYCIGLTGSKMQDKPHKCDPLIIQCIEQDKFNYTIEIIKPDGETVFILIPVNLRQHDDTPYGLNMASSGHYV